ncbi:MAG: S8 family peptidase [Bacteroidetes bacterium]|nr:S8 family peptidase [Bacteroidota bacterium]
MKNVGYKSIVPFLLLSIVAMAQSNLTLLQKPNLVTESNIYLDEDNNKYSDVLTINFNGNIIDLPVGVAEASINDISDVNVKNYLTSLETQYGNITIEKVFPDLIWGDTQRTNKRTGEPVIINDLSQVFQIHFSSLVPIEDMVSALSNYTVIEYAEGPYEVYKLSTEPNDPWYTSGEHWNLDSVFAKFAWDFTLGDTTITISINDFYDPNVTTLHEDLVDKVDYQHFNYAGGHGSAVAGVASATTNNNLGIASLGWNLRLRLDEFYINGINAAIEGGADVINFSWLFQSSTLENTIHNALLQGIVCVAGAGNANFPVPFVAYPAAYNFGNDGQVIAVSATQLDPLFNYTEHFAYTWNHSPGTDPILDPTNAFIDVTAPGVLVPLVSAYWSNYYVLDSGTSFSSPLVAALAGLILSIDNSLTPPQVYNIITSTTDKIDPNGAINYQYDENGWSRWMGYGRINAWDALNVASGAPHRPQNFTADFSGVNPSFTWEANIEPDLLGYRFYKKLTTASSGTITSYQFTTSTSYTDYDFTIGGGRFAPDNAEYWVVSVDSTNLLSIETTHYNTNGTSFIQWKVSNGDKVKPSVYKLNQNYPNPFNPSTTIKYNLKENGYVSLKIYDILGREVANLISEKQIAGSYNVIFNADGLVSGVYIYKLKVNDFIEAKKMILTK